MLIDTLGINDHISSFLVGR